MDFCACCGLFQREGSSARTFSSSSLFVATSQSKMPPQQVHSLPDFIDHRLDFSPHTLILRNIFQQF
ncbi:MAG: hypothetical protein COB90_03540 [Hyphomicrobiales bacterium]|nr:MAG: hypothetical protein COB90_03540 [Hyphomicrobiales bacterium]